MVMRLPSTALGGLFSSTVLQPIEEGFPRKGLCMNVEHLLSLTIPDLEGMAESALGQHYPALRDICNALNQHKNLWGQEDVRRTNYYHLRMMQSIALLLLLGKGGGKWLAYSIWDVRGTVLDYFDGTNRGALNGGEARRFLEYLLTFKRQHDFLENDLDTLLTDIVDDYPDLGPHNFTNDTAWFTGFRRFAKGLRHRSAVYAHGKPIGHFTLANKMKDLYYDELARLIDRLSAGIAEDAQKDGKRGRKKLSAALNEARVHLDKATAALNEAWSHCHPYVDQERKRGGLEHIFDTEEVKANRIGQFVHSYLLTLRMHGESDADTHYLSLLDGYNYREALASDPWFEAKIDALIAGLELIRGEEMPIIERELNARIGRDVWTRQ